jgi:hypothetical protein
MDLLQATADASPALPVLILMAAVLALHYVEGGRWDD